jgi:NDP-sugar pyrophosphorylase family protein
MQALILVGGLGTRLRPAVGDLPKAMAPAAGRPFLEYVIEYLALRGVGNVVLAVGHLSEAIRRHFGDGGRHGVRIRYSVEATPRGTAGAVRLARPMLGETFFVLNGDTFVEVDYAAMARAHEAAGTFGSIALRRVADAARYGTVELNPGGRVRRFHEKAESAGDGSGDGPAQGNLINAGVYRFTAAVFDAIADGGAASMEYDVLPKLASCGELSAWRTGGYFMDIGLPETLKAFENDVLNRAIPGF